MSGGKPRETVGQDAIQMTVRFSPVVHHYLTQESKAQGVSVNTLVNRACAQAMAPPGGSAMIARARRRLVPRAGQVEAAVALGMAYLGRLAEARRLWPAAWGDFPGTGTREDLVAAGGLFATEIDAPTPTA